MCVCGRFCDLLTPPGCVRLLLSSSPCVPIFLLKLYLTVCLLLFLLNRCLCCNRVFICCSIISPFTICFLLCVDFVSRLNCQCLWLVLMFFQSSFITVPFLFPALTVSVSGLFWLFTTVLFLFPGLTVSVSGLS